MTHTPYAKRHLILGLVISCIGLEPVQGQSAQQITQDNAERLVQHGPDATGGIGDWSLSNGTVCAIISDVEHEGEFSTKGGILIDLGFCGRGDDLYTFTQDMVDGKRTRPIDTQSIKASKSPDSASVIVESSEGGIIQTTRYHLNTKTPTQLHISKTITRVDDNKQSAFNFLSSVNFNNFSLEPFIFASNDIHKSTGFVHQEFVKTGIKALPKAAKKTDTIISLSPPDAVQPIAYAWQLKSAQRVDGNKRFDIPWFTLADDGSNAFIYLSDTFYFGNNNKLGWLQLPQIPLLTLDKGSTLEIEQTIYIGKHADVASITDQFFIDGVTLSGQVNEINSAIHIDQIDGTPLTHVRPQKDGSFKLKIPSGNYQLRHIGSAGRIITKKISLNKNTNLGDLSLPQTSSLELPSNQAMRLVFKGINGTEPPSFNDSFTKLAVIENGKTRVTEPNSQVFLSGKDGDKGEVELAPGSYLVYATKGPEYSLEKTEITIKKGDRLKLDIDTPRHIVKTPGYIASDLHVHSGISFDNNFSASERVRTFVAEHGEVMVSSEHDVPVDFTPFINQMGVQDQIISIAAVEITSLFPSKRLPYTGGHINVFPYTPKPHAFRRGMINHEDRRLREIIHGVKQVEPTALIQLNHPRTNLDFSSNELPDDYHEHIDYAHYLDHMGVGAHPYNPEQPLHSHPNNVLIEKDPETGLRDLDFDLIEVINPGGPEHEARLKAVRKDWLSFLKQGEKIVATANSDSHNSNTQVAVPRTMVAMDDDNVRAFDQNEFLKSLKSGNAYGTTGPMINLSLGGKRMGEILSAQQGNLKLVIHSADWINVDMAKVQINGETIIEKSLNNKAENNVTSYELEFPLTFTEDSFVTVEVSGNASKDYQIIYPEITPYAFSNAIYVDHDNDGQWQAPGL